MEHPLAKFMHVLLDGGPGSGHWTHAGREGKKGGSLPGKGSFGYEGIPDWVINDFGHLTQEIEEYWSKHQEGYNLYFSREATEARERMKEWQELGWKDYKAGKITYDDYYKRKTDLERNAIKKSFGSQELDDYDEYMKNTSKLYRNIYGEPRSRSHRLFGTNYEQDNLYKPPAKYQRIRENIDVYKNPNNALKAIAKNYEPLNPKSDEFKKVVGDALASRHKSHKFDIEIEKVYKFKGEATESQLKTRSRLGNHEVLYHGTGNLSAAMIVTNGFSKSNYHNTGSMMGDGVYMARNFSKSAQYISGSYWLNNSGTRQSGYVFSFDVAKGSVLENGGKATDYKILSVNWGLRDIMDKGNYYTVRAVPNRYNGLKMTEFLLPTKTAQDQVLPLYMFKINTIGEIE